MKITLKKVIWFVVILFAAYLAYNWQDVVHGFMDSYNGKPYNY